MFLKFLMIFLIIEFEICALMLLFLSLHNPRLTFRLSSSSLFWQIWWWRGDCPFGNYCRRLHVIYLNTYKRPYCKPVLYYRTEKFSFAMRIKKCDTHLFVQIFWKPNLLENCASATNIVTLSDHCTITLWSFLVLWEEIERFLDSVVFFQRTNNSKKVPSIAPTDILRFGNRADLRRLRHGLLDIELEISHSQPAVCTYFCQLNRILASSKIAKFSLRKL